jgi:hypothetical protein
MWIILLEVLLTGAGIFLGPVIVVVAMGRALASADRLFHASGKPHRLPAAPQPVQGFGATPMPGSPGSNDDSAAGPLGQITQFR